MNIARLFFALLLLTPVLTKAATFNVSTTPELRVALADAAINGEDDTIMLADGTYKTTDDGLGTFIYLSNEENKLTLIGSSADNVILSGDSTDQILNHRSTEDAPMTLEKLSFVDGNNDSGDGGGVYTDYTLKVIDCNFENNRSSSNGGGISLSKYNLTVIGSSFKSNTANYGSAISNQARTSIAATISIKKSTFSNNQSSAAGTISVGGGSFSALLEIYDSVFKRNSSPLRGIIDNGGYESKIFVHRSFFQNNNKAIEFSGGCMAEIELYNSIFINNKIKVNKNSDCINYTEHKDKIYASLFKNSDLFINSQNNNIANNVFENSNITGDLNAILHISNNYIELSDMDINFFSENNIYEGVYLGFVDADNDNYSLIESSGLIDGGSVDIYDIAFPRTDFNGNARVVGGSMDIGPYEFTTTKPTINLLTYSGDTKELSELTFNTDYTLSDDDRVLSYIYYDYNNDEGWTDLDTHTFDTSGTYTVNVMVADSEGEFSTSSIEIIVEPLPFADMTDAQKLVKAIEPQYYDEIVQIIESDKQAENTNGIAAGKQYVQDNPIEFDLVTTGDQNLAIADAVSVQIQDCVNSPSSCGINIYGTTDSSANHTYTLSEGWNLIGGKDASDTTAIQTFMNEHNADSIWHWDGSWKSYIKGTPEFLNGLQSMEGNKGYWLHVPEQ